MPAAAFFDLDKTVIAKSSTLAFGRSFYAGGLINRRAMLKSAYAQFVYLVAGADENQMDAMRDYLKALCAGWPVDQVKQIVRETLHELIDPIVYDEAVELIREHQAAGRTVVIVSSSGREVVEPVGEMLGVDEVVATTMRIEDGAYTGDIDFYAYGPFKAEAMQAMADERGWDLADCFAYSDSGTDLPMLELVGHPTAVNPDKALRKAAEERGWEVRTFAKPVSLRSRISGLRPNVHLPSVPTVPVPPKRVTIGAGTVAAVALAGWGAWLLRGRLDRRRSRLELALPRNAWRALKEQV